MFGIEFLFLYGWFLFFLLPFGIYFFYKKQTQGIPFSCIADVKNTAKKHPIYFFAKGILLFGIGSVFIVLISNPHLSYSQKDITKHGIDIVIAFDVSGSMEAQDLTPNRMEAAKKVVNDFIGKLKSDRVGLVVFSGKPFTSIPLTFDYNILSETIQRLSTSTINQNQRGLDGTAIGDALLMSKTLFKSPKDMTEDEYSTREKVVILLTDGDANRGVEPKLAAQLLQESQIKIYSIGIGNTQGGKIYMDVGGGYKREVPIPPLNSEALKELSTLTKGEFFAATDNTTFENIFQQLQKLQKNDIRIEVQKMYVEYYTPFLYVLLVGVSLFILLFLKDLQYASRKY